MKLAIVDDNEIEQEIILNTLWFTARNILSILKLRHFQMVVHFWVLINPLITIWFLWIFF